MPWVPAWYSAAVRSDLDNVPSLPSWEAQLIEMGFNMRRYSPTEDEEDVIENDISQLKPNVGTNGGESPPRSTSSLCETVHG